MSNFKSKVISFAERRLIAKRFKIRDAIKQQRLYNGHKKLLAGPKGDERHVHPDVVI